MSMKLIVPLNRAWATSWDRLTASYFARGKYGQTIGVFPDEDVVIVRLGTIDAGVDWQARLQEIATQLDSGP